MSLHELDEYRPHKAIHGKVMLHILPLRTLKDIANRKLKVSDVEGIDDFMPTIIAEWLETKQ